MAGIEIASLFARVTVLDDATKGLQGISKGLGDLSKQMGDVGSSLLKIGLPLAGFFGAAIKSAADSEAATAQLNAVLKSTKGVAGVTAKQALNLASALQKVTKFSDEDVLSAENLLLTFTNIKKDVFPQVTKLALDMSEALGQDLKSSSIQLGKALQDPINGITALSRVGVNFTEAQKAQVKAMVESGNLLGAQKLILKELQTEFGGSAEAAGKTFGGQLTILKNQFDDLLESVGTALLPALKDIIKDVTPIIGKLADWIEKNPQVVKTLGEITLAIVGGGGLLKAIEGIGGAIGGLFTPIGLLVVAIGGILFWANQTFGGLDQLIVRATDSADKLVKIIGYFAFDLLSKASKAAQDLGKIISYYITDTLNRAATAARQVVDLIDMALNPQKYGIDTKGGELRRAPDAPSPSEQFARHNSQHYKTAPGGAMLTRASGGPIPPFRTSVVGERGPELLTMGSQGGHITPGYSGPTTLVLKVDLTQVVDEVVVNIADAMRQRK